MRRKNRVLRMLLAAALVFIFCVRAPAMQVHCEEAAPVAAVSPAKAVLEIVNVQRRNAGLGDLVWSDRLAKDAEVRAQEAIVCWSHNRPNGRPWFDVDPALIYGENLGRNFASPDLVVFEWLRSPSHCANLLGRYNIAGVGMAQDAYGNWYWALEFGR